MCGTADLCMSIERTRNVPHAMCQCHFTLFLSVSIVLAAPLDQDQLRVPHLAKIVFEFLVSQRFPACSTNV